MDNQILSKLNAMKVPYRWLDHPPVFTVAESLAVIQKSTPIKNLLLVDKAGKTFLVIMAGMERLDTKALATRLGSRKLQFADADLLMSTLGVTPGSVSLFSLLHDGAADVTTVIDQNLVQSGVELGFHPNRNTATIFFDGEHLEPLINGLGRSYVVASLY